MIPVNEPKPTITIPFELLPEAKFWGVGHDYRVKNVVRLVGLSEKDATFELIDASSLSHQDKLKRSFMSGNTYHE